ncbi:MAG: hypothetical protein Q7O66_00420 [Dehalococcoidia bacterium]|nr:hypothetical protein [Dehalococcoidia bacterium]
MNSGSVTAIGDSVMLGAISTLRQAIAGIDVDAAVGRQASVAVGLLKSLRFTGQLGEVVVVQVGNNGVFTASEFDELMQVLEPARRVIFITVKVPRRWEGPNNGVMVDGVKRYQNAATVDWYAASIERPDLFWDDGIHLRPAGAQVYADLIVSALSNP